MSTSSPFEDQIPEGKLPGMDYIRDRDSIDKPFWMPIDDEAPGPFDTKPASRAGGAIYAGPDQMWRHERLGVEGHNAAGLFAYERRMPRPSECPGYHEESQTTPDMPGYKGNYTIRSGSDALTLAEMNEFLGQSSGKTWRERAGSLVEVVDGVPETRGNSLDGAQVMRIPSLGSIPENEEPDTPESPERPTFTTMSRFPMGRTTFDMAENESSVVPETPMSPTSVKEIPPSVAFLPLQDIERPVQRGRVASTEEVTFSSPTRVTFAPEVTRGRRGSSSVAKTLHLSTRGLYAGATLLSPPRVLSATGGLPKSPAPPCMRRKSSADTEKVISSPSTTPRVTFEPEVTRGRRGSSSVAKTIHLSTRGLYAGATLLSPPRVLSASGGLPKSPAPPDMRQK